jgi:hypothetical protein
MTVNGNPRCVMTPRTSSSTSVAFTYASLTFSPLGPLGPCPRSNVTA